jgi:transcriptional regulator GlxA family with amidase domain
MYLQKVNSSQNATPDIEGGLRSLTKSFVFISQSRKTRFAAESCIDVLRTANMLNGQNIYSWSHQIAKNGEFSSTECNLNQTIVLAGNIFDPWLPTTEQCAQIRSPLRTAARVCVVGSAIFVPLCAGILKTQRAAVHPHFRAAVKERGYLSEFHSDTVCHQSSLSSAVSPAAAIEMMIQLIAAQDGAFIQSALHNQLGLTSDQSVIRSREHWHLKRLAEGNLVISEALDIMLDHLEDTISVGQIADIMSVSPRRLERIFGEKIKLSPLQVYRSLRLEQAQQLLLQTELPIGEISFACGFSNVTLLTKWYRKKFGVQPSLERKSAYFGQYAA